MIQKPSDCYINSHTIIDACKPYEWINEFPEGVKVSPELVVKVKGKWGKMLKL